MASVIPERVAASASRSKGKGLQDELGAGLVARPRLIRRIRAAGGASLVLLTGPPGYSKTTSLEEWSARDERPFAWVAATARQDDPAVLLFSIVDALDEIEPVDSEVLAPLLAPNPDIPKAVLPRLVRALQRRTKPFVLVVDDVHALNTETSLAVIATIVDSVPAGSQVALAARSEPRLPLGRLRANRLLVELTAAELAMTRDEGEALLRNLGLDLTPAQADLMIERTEGWPAALYLAGYALSEQSDLNKAVSNFAGDDRIVVDYVRDEFLSATSPDEVAFLTRTSILDELTGPLCDALFDQRGSGEMLEELARSNALVIPLDRHGGRYRYHHLFAEMLRAELRRHEPEAEEELHARASRWYAEEGDSDRAIDHAIAANDIALAGTLIWRAFPEVSGRGRIATLERWLDRIGDERNAKSAELALTRAHVHINLGEGDRTAHWNRVAAAAAASSGEGSASVEADILLLKAILGVDGVVAVGRDAACASELHPPEAVWQGPCYMFRGVSSHLAGHPERAKPLLQEAVRRAAVSAPVVQTMSLAQLSLIALDDDDSETAFRLVTQARDQVVRCGLTEYPSIAIVYATSALVTARRGRMDQSQADTKAAKRLLSRIVDLPPWYDAEARIALAGAEIRLDDLNGARAVLKEAEGFLGRTPDAAMLSQWLGEAREALETASSGGRGVNWSLTGAELRTLQYLPSHLSFREIGERIHVSPNTVKTQARAVYRKMDASSRAEAVEAARDAGLLGEDPLRE